MTTRRQVIQAGAAVGAVMGGAVGPAASALAASPVAERLVYRKVAFDSRHKPSLGFAAEARRLGADVHDIDGNVTGLYADHLLDRWRLSPDPVAGMTTYASMFVLKMMAEGAGLRLIYQARHQTGPDGAYRHDQFGPTVVLEQGGDLSGQPLEWTRKAARVVMAWPTDATGCANAQSTIARADLTTIGQDTLVSWILAPARRA